MMHRMRIEREISQGHSHCPEDGYEIRSKKRVDELLRMGH